MTADPGDGLKSGVGPVLRCSGLLLRSLLTAQIWLATPPPTGNMLRPPPVTLVRDEMTLQMSVTDTGAGIRYVEFTANYSGTWHR